MSSDPDRVERELRVNADPATVFAYFTDGEKLTRWMGVEALLEPEPGGAFRVEMPGRVRVAGQFLEVVPGRRLVFTWEWFGDNHSVPPGRSTVAIDFVPDNAGTIVRVVHSNLATGHGERHGQGWDNYLARMAVVVVGRDPGPDSWA